ncbi:MAG: leucine-rich repeat domain-containing protein [Clostridiales bacterium]|nr:leucine-rich repeat domain-containing protein [Clostridiales bacterium]
MKKRILVCMLVIIAALSCALVACTDNKKPPEHVHTFPGEWEYDDNQHWHECECGEKDTILDHSYNSQGVCIRCGRRKDPDKVITDRAGNFEVVERADGTYSIKGLIDTSLTSVTVPTHTDAGKVITAIEESAFVVDVEKKIFNENLEEIILPEGLLEIGEFAFWGCQKLKGITIPSTVTKIGKGAFNACPELTEVIIPDTVTNLNTDSMFANSTKLTRVVIGNGAKSIGDYCFNGCTALSEVVLGSNVTSIGSYAFFQCSSLTSISIPDSVTSIGGAAFRYCSKLATLNLGADSLLVSMGQSAFQDCTSLISVKLPANFETLGDNAFASCSGITSFTFNNKLETIGSVALMNCSNIESITIPSSVKTIGAGAFFGLGKITSLVVPDTVEELGIYFLGGCDSLETLTLPFVGNTMELRQHIGYFFDDQTNSNGTLARTPADSNMQALPSKLKTITITKATGLGDYAFASCQYLEKISVPDSVMFVGYSGFSDCPKLEVTKENNAEYVGNKDNPHLILAQSTGTNINSCTINPNTKIIAGNAFNGCKFLTKLTIPDSVISVGRSAFTDCNEMIFRTENNLKYVPGTNNTHKVLVRAANFDVDTYTIHSDTKIIAGGAFSGCSSLVDLQIPDGVVTIGASAFSSCDGLVNLTIPDSIKSIENKAFDSCKSLTEITIGNGLEAIDGDTFINCKIEKASVPGIAALGMVHLSDTLKEVHITSGTSIPDGAFQRFSLLKTVTMADTVKTIGEGAFYYCRALTSINLPNQLERIGENAFNYLESMTGTLVIPDSVTYIGELAFERAGYTKVVIGKNVRTIESRAFAYLYSLEEIEVVDGNEYFYSVDNCVIERATKTLVYGANKSKLPTDGSITKIGAYSFTGRKGLTSIDLDAGVTRFESGAFAGTDELVEINFTGTKNQYLNIYKGDQCFFGSGGAANRIIINCSNGKLEYNVSEATYRELA